MTVVEKKWQRWRFGITIAVAIVFGLQTHTLLSQLMARPTASSFTLVDDVPPRMPAVTVCPSLPFSADSLIDFGLNTSCDNYKDCTILFIEDQSLNKKVSLQELWNASSLPLSTYIHSTNINGRETRYHPKSNTWPYWKPSITSLGSCWTLNPPPQEPGDVLKPLIIYIKSQIPCSVTEAGIFYLFDPFDTFPSCEVAVDICKNNCPKERLLYTLYEQFNNIIILLHNHDEAPAVINAQNTLSIYDGVGKDTTVNTWVSLRKSYLQESDNCVSNLEYSLSKCMSICYRKYVAKEFDCFSSTNFADLVNKTCIHQFMEYKLRITKILSATEEDEDLAICRRSCKTPCKSVQYSFFSNFLHNNYYIKEEQETSMYKFTLQMSAPFTETVVEEVIYTASKFLSDLGGSLGLCFGLGLLTLHEIFYIVITKIYKWLKKLRYDDNVWKGATVTYNDPEKWEFHFQRIWMMCGTTFFLVAFAAHSLQLTMSYLEYQKVSVPNLGNTPPPFPGVTLCPDVPFDLTALSKQGLNAINKSELETECREKNKCDREVAISYLLNTLPGVWESNLTLDTIWNFTRPFDALVTGYEYDTMRYNGKTKEIITTMDKCFLFSPDTSETDTILLDIFLVWSKLYISQELPFVHGLYNSYNSYSVVIMLHPLQETPIIPRGSVFTHEKNELLKLSLEIEIIVVKRISTPRLQCKEKPFSQSKCIDLCVLQTTAEEISCRLPYLQEYDLPLCNSSYQYAKSFKGNSESSAETRKYCEEMCGLECETVYYKMKAEIIDDMHGLSNKPDISIIKSSLSTLEITEQLKTSLLSYLSEMGGILGLYLGMSLLDFITLMLWPVTYFLKRNEILKSIVPSHAFKIFKLAWILIMTLLLMTFSLTRLQDFLINPKIYTKYSTQTNKWKDFPGISICRWPPFNVSKLVSLGINFEVDDYCEYDNGSAKYYCSGYLDEFMNDLPGLENTSVHRIWEQAALNVSDMLNAYTFSGKHYVVGSPNAVHWKAKTTALNQCFTFIPPEVETEASDLNLHLSKAGIKHYSFPTRPTVLQVIRDAMANGPVSYWPQTIIRIHSPNEEPKTNDLASSYPVYLNVGKFHMELTATLTEESRLNRRRQQCIESTTYSQFNCIQECLLHEVVKEEKCILPFTSSFAKDECNLTSYKWNLKYLDKMSQKVGQYREKKKGCESECPPGCKTLKYEVQVRVKDSFNFYNYPNGHTRVTITMGKPGHDAYEEVLALSWASFMAEVGGVAGILTGVSLLTIAQSLLTGFIQLYLRFITFFKRKV